MSKKKSHEEYVEELKNINSDIEVVGTYIDNKTPILHHCKIHDIEWYARPYNILSGKSCMLCKSDKIKSSKRMSECEYVERLSVSNPSVELIGKYINANTPTMHRCKIHDIQWIIRPVDALKGNGCKKCHLERFSKSKSKTHNEYVRELELKNANVEVVGAYIKAKIPIEHRCKICGSLWIAMPDNVLHGTGCPICNVSRGEKEISTYLSKKNINFIPQYTFDECKNKKLLPFDFYLPEYNLCIEYDGEQHYKPVNFFGGKEKLEKTTQRDRIKTNFCLTNNIKLLRIRYDEDIITSLENFFNSTKLIKEVV